MLFLVLNWAFLFFISGVFGIFLIKNILNEDIYFDNGFLFVLSQVVGLIFISNLLLFISIKYPIKNTLILVIFLLSLIIFLFSKDIRLKLNDCFSVFNQIGKIKFILLLGLIGFYESQTIFWGDSAIYHINSVKWIHEYGIVFGTANLIKQLGFTSSWFALNASIQLDGNYIGASYSVLGGYILLLMIVHFIYCLKKITHGQNQNEFYLFYLFGYPLIILLIFRWGVGLSPSPDVIINYMGLLVAGVIISELKINSKTSLIFLLATLYFSIKLSAISLIIFSLYLIARNFNCISYKKIILISFLIAPILVCNIIASGYPLYPSELFGLGVEWKVPKPELIQVNNSIYNHAFHNTTDGNLLKPYEFYDIVQWLFSRKEWITGILLFFNIIGIYIIALKKGYKYINIIVFVLISFIIFLNAPTLRFGLNWLVLIPAISATLTLGRFVFYKIDYLYNYLVYLLLLAISILFIYPINPMQIKLQNQYPNSMDLRFFLPSKIVLFENIHGDDGLVKDVRDLNFSIFKIDGIDFYNGNGFCWDIDLPCSENLNIRLINPEKGIGGGFKAKN